MLVLYFYLDECTCVVSFSDFCEVTLVSHDISIDILYR